jgi:hypothetical protein
VNTARRHKQNRSRGASIRPSFVHHDNAKIDLPLNKRGKRSAERRMPSMSALRKQVYAVCATHSLRGCATSSQRRARLSALTLAALATGYHPDGSAPEPGFPPTSRAGVLPAWPFCRRLSTLRADRSFCRSTGDPEPPGSGWHIRARAPPLASVFQACPSGKAPSMSEVLGM